MPNIPWHELMRIALHMGIQPKNFWDMTYQELQALVPEKGVGVSRQELEALLNSHINQI